MPPVADAGPAHPVRVLRVITRLNIGGPSIQAATLTARLRPHGFETTLVHGRLGAGEGDMSYLLSPAATAVYEPTLQREVAPFDDVRAIRQLYDLMRRVRPAIVHTHMAKAGAVARTAAIFYNRRSSPHERARLVHTYHGHVLEGYFSGPKTALFIAAERRLARVTDRIVAISPQIRHDLLRTYGIGRQEQYVVVPLGFDLSVFEQIDERARLDAREALRIPADASVISTVGRLTAIKQHALFLDAARLIREARPATVFLIAGDGELRKDLESRTRALGLDSHVRFLGWRRDLATIYAATDVFALTSRNEGTPVALIEAMASGVPGVSTNVGGVGDVIVDDSAGRRVPDGDPQAFAAAVIELLAARDRDEIGQRARRLVVGRFGIERLVMDIATVYRDLLKPAI
jgi:glycosyltransferase involved in cell wall biosynthesis